MAENSGIEWTDHTINLWWGCEKVSPGCKNCYAETLSKRFADDIWGKNKPRRYIKSAIKDAHRLNRKAEREGVRYKVFAQSMSDVFEDHDGPIVDTEWLSLWICPACHVRRDGAIPEVQKTGPICNACDLVMHPLAMPDLRRDLFATIDATPNLDWLILTKRPENIRKMWPKIDHQGHCWHLNNVWLGTSVENQEQADKRIPELLKCRDLSPVLWLSCEPLLGLVELSLDGIDWVIAGGESGSNARPSHPDWFRSLRDQCQAAGVPFFFKQHGEWLHESQDFSGIDMTRFNQQPNRYFFGWEEDDSSSVLVGKKKAGRILDGRTWDEFPELTHEENLQGCSSQKG